jgi:acetyl-CoA carboxylase alpha subunit
LDELTRLSPEQLRTHRYHKYRSIGTFQEEQQALLAVR